MSWKGIKKLNWVVRRWLRRLRIGLGRSSLLWLLKQWLFGWGRCKGTSWIRIALFRRLLSLIGWEVFMEMSGVILKIWGIIGRKRRLLKLINRLWRSMFGSNGKSYCQLWNRWRLRSNMLKLLELIKLFLNASRLGWKLFNSNNYAIKGQNI